MSIQNKSSSAKFRTINVPNYSSANGDFKATANSGAKTITIKGLSFTLTANHVIFGEVLLITSEGNSCPLPLDTVTVSSGVITLADMDQNFASGDTVEVTLAGSPRTQSKELDVTKITDIKPAWSRTSSSIPVITAAQTLTFVSLQDVGSEIPCQGYKYAYIYMTTTIQQSSNLRLAIMAKHESAGAEEMPLDDGFVTISGTTVTAPSTAALPYFEQTEDVNADLLIKVDLNNCVAYLQIQAYAGTDGGTDGTIDTCDVILGY